MSNLDSYNKLTEFPPLQPEPDEYESSSIGKFSKLTKFLWWRKNDPPSKFDPNNCDTYSLNSETSESICPNSINSLQHSQSDVMLSGVGIDPHIPDSVENLNEQSGSISTTPGSAIIEGRNLPNVLRRISSLIATSGSSNSSDLRKYWMPDSVSKECYDCAEKFTTFRRKHHCRICGQIFCSRCCNQEIPGKVIGVAAGDLRVCTYCCKIVLSYLNSADLGEDNMGRELRLVQEDLQSRYGGSGAEGPSVHFGQTDYIPTYRSLPRRKASLVYQEERFIGATNDPESSSSSSGATAKNAPRFIGDWVSIKSLWDDMVVGLEWSSGSRNAAAGSEIVDWLLAQRKISLREQGVQVGQMLMDVNLIESVGVGPQDGHEGNVFFDAYILYRPLGVGSGSGPLEPLDEEERSTRSNSVTDGDSGVPPSGTLTQRLSSTSSLYSLDINPGSNTATMSMSKSKLDSTVDRDPYASGSASATTSKSPTPKNLRKPSSNKSSSTSASSPTTDEFLRQITAGDISTTWHAHQLTTDEEVLAFQSLVNSYVLHENNLLCQLLQRRGLSSSWAEIILPIVHKVTETVRPDLRNADEMDIRQYIHFKKVPGGQRIDSRIINGIVCTKNVANRRMKKRLKAPKILLLGASIDYHRFENRFQALEPLVMQEHDYLKNTVGRISSTLPDLLLVQKSVSRLAQEFLLDLGITLVLNVKNSVMERVQRSTGALIETSADSQITKPQLGLCHHFYVETYRTGKTEPTSKSLMFFDGCPMHLGCTVLLRGGTESELVKVKEVIRFMMFVAYNWRLERSLHIDMLAEPPVLTLQQQAKKETSEPQPPSSPITTAPVQINDFSDPLQSSKTPIKSEGDDDRLIVQIIADPAAADEELHQSFSQALNTTILSASPFISYSLPYMETPQGASCALRSYFPKEIYWSPLFLKGISSGARSIGPKSPAPTDSTILLEPPHPFLTDKIIKPVEDDGVQRLIADFRRKGGRLGFDGTARTVLSHHLTHSQETVSQVNVDIEETTINYKPNLDVLDPFNHQRLSVLFYSFSPISSNAPYFCVSPWVVDMDMYRRDDISLGMFLERYCFRKSYLCPARQCDMPMVSSHVRRFVHGTGAITVGLKEIEKPLFGTPSSTIHPPPIHLLSWCPQCKTMSRIVPLSSDAWSLSFAKYLDIRFHGQEYKRRSHGGQPKCPHSLHHDNVQHFSQRNIIASFTYAPIRLWEICLPVRVLDVRTSPKSVAHLIDDCKSVAIVGHNVYTTILELLLGLRESGASGRVEEIIKALLEQLKVEQSVFRSKIEDIQMNLTGQNLTRASLEVEQILWKISAGIGFLKNFISDTIQAWNLRLADLIAFRKKDEKQGLGSSAKSNPALLTSSENVESISTSSSKVPSSDNLSLGQNTTDSSENSASGSSNATTGPELSTIPAEIGGMDSQSRPRLSTEFTIGDSEIPSIIVPPSTKDTTDSKRSSTGGVKSLISHLMSGSGGAGGGAGPMVPFPWAQSEHHLQSGLSSHPIPIYENEPSSLVAFALSSHEYKKKRQELLVGSNAANGTLPITSKVSEDPTHLSVLTKNENSSEDFLSSISSNNGGNVLSGMMSNSIGTGADIEDEHTSTDPTSSPHIEVQFSSGTTAKFQCRVYFAESFRQLRKMVLVAGESSASAANVEDFYIRSISRCIPWAARGGKSGSTFCKTADDRFIVKQMSKFEIHSFLDFAPNYFQYLKGCYKHSSPKRPTLLSKIVGVYRIGFRNSNSGSGGGTSSGGSKCDILIMENLFYNRGNISQKFDLKGSIRNRLAPTTTTTTGDQDLVLLDENLVNMATENPLYVRPHTKRVLRAGVENDSKFLSSQMVMDYSLLVGLDAEKGELVVGIIDYIRTFTWDKKIETFVKSSGILGGQGKTPTVISPDEYQARFCEAMDKYFLLVPDRWVGLGQMEVQPNGTNKAQQGEQ